jgi:hypothetical protein
VATLKITNNSVSNPLTLDLSGYMDVQEGQGMDPADPQFSNRVWTRSILKEGATLALEQLTEKELVFPLKLGPIGGLTGAPQTFSALATLIQQINQIIETPGATCTWQPDNASQPTTFDLLSGQLDVDYDFRMEQQKWTQAKLRLFTQPLGRTAAPRTYATASGVGPLLMITPYASGGGQVIGASTQAGVAGYGAGVPGGVPSGGIFYWGSPSLAGDAPALLQISYVGPLPNGSLDFGQIPTTILSLLPDLSYEPLYTAAQIKPLYVGDSEALIQQSTSVASSYRQLRSVGVQQPQVQWGIQVGASGVPLAWAGQQRLFAIARASGTTPSLAATVPPAIYQAAGSLRSSGASVLLQPGLDWGIYDLGTFSLRASEPPAARVSVNAVCGESQAVDLAALVMLPDAASWFMSPAAIQAGASGYGTPSSLAGDNPLSPVSAFTNTLVLDDVLGDQFVFYGASQQSAPSPAGAVVPSATRMTQFARGLVPRPDPKAGMPIIALLSVAQAGAQATPYAAAGFIPGGASWANPQNVRTMAQVNVLERTRYVLP